MDFIVELIADLILAAGIFLVQWCIRHKNVTMTILAVALIVIDLFVMFKVLHIQWG